MITLWLRYVYVMITLRLRYDYVMITLRLRYVYVMIMLFIKYNINYAGRTVLLKITSYNYG